MCKAPKEDEFRGAESTGASKGLMAGANLFGLINAVLTCVVLGIVATRGGDVTKKSTTNNAAAAGTTTTLAIPDFLKGYTHYGENPCIDPSIDKAPLRRTVEACEVGRTALVLASDYTSAITGEILHADAGFHVEGMVFH